MYIYVLIHNTACTQNNIRIDLVVSRTYGKVYICTYICTCKKIEREREHYRRFSRNPSRIRYSAYVIVDGFAMRTAVKCVWCSGLLKHVNKSINRHRTDWKLIKMSLLANYNVLPIHFTRPILTTNLQPN